MIFSFLFTAVTVVSCAAGTAKEDEVYLRASTGPYRGRVIDAKSKQPIAGVIVVAVWYRDVYAFVQSNETYYDAIEVVTDSQGNFVVDAPNIERRAPSNTKFPRFVILKPGYTYFQGWFAPIDVLFDRKNKSLLGVVELESISHLSKGEQSRQIPSPPHSVPDEMIPMFLKARRSQQERISR